METADFDAFLRWGEDCDEFPDLQYTLGNDETFSWDQILDQYLDPSEYLEPFPLGALAPIEEKVEAIDALPELSPSPTQQYDVQTLSESITELKDRLNGLEDRHNGLEDRYRTPSPLTIGIQDLTMLELRRTGSQSAKQLHYPPHANSRQNDRRLGGLYREPSAIPLANWHVYRGTPDRGPKVSCSMR